MRRARQRCITCTPSDWQAIQDLAQAAGMKTSPFILSRVLGGVNRMALTAEEQRNLHDRAAWCWSAKTCCTPCPDAT